ncbi:MAG TPA: hypothetical protein VGF67_22445 [Ktedonobacteraceae bacterium]|jgi:hypothetical protein
MRVAAVAFVLVVGAAVVLAFANTLNTWVLGGLLGGLAAILLSIPISLTLFTLLARRHEVHPQGADARFERDLAYAERDAYGEPVIYEAEGHVLPMEEDAFSDRARRPVSGYLALPPLDGEPDEYDEYDEDEEARRDPRNYPRRPRSVRPPAAEGESRQQARAYRNPSTYSLAQHQAQARRQARQEARERSLNRSSGRTRPAPTPPSLHSRTSGQMRPQGTGSASRRPPETYDSRFSERPVWPEEEEEVREDFLSRRTRAQQMQRRRNYRPDPRASRADERWTTGRLDDERERGPQRRRRPDPERGSGNLQNSLLRRAPYLYEDDPLREEFARQLRHDPPITRRFSRYQSCEDEEENGY